MQQDKFEYFMERTEKDLSEIKKDQKAMLALIDKLTAFRWQIIGGSVVLSAIVGWFIKALA